MQVTELKKVESHELLARLKELVAGDRTSTAALLAHLAEVERRGLYRAAACSSMYDYCIRRLHFSEYETVLRLRAARVVRRYPSALASVADGRLHMSAIVRLAPYLTHECASDLFKAAEHKTRIELDTFLAARFPRPDLATRMDAMAPAPAAVTTMSDLLGPDPVLTRRQHPFVPPMGEPAREAPASDAPPTTLPSSDPAGQPPSCPVHLPSRDPAMRGRLTPLAAERVALQMTVARSTCEKLRHAEALLGRTVAPGDLAAVLDRALNALIERLEKRRFGSADCRREPRTKPSSDSRHVPVAVRRTVWERDGGRCTFESASGERCEERRSIEFDHIRPVACGGRSTVDNLRLRCRPHNQYEAERAFGTDHVRAKRDRRRR